MVKSSPRHRARELALKGVYALECGQTNDHTIFEKVISDENLTEKQTEFAKRLFDLTVQKKEWAEDIIENLAENWDIERIAMIDLIVLRMALVEMDEMADVPVKVVINEALELVKTFSTENSYRFVNGLLDRYAKDTNKEDKKLLPGDSN